MFRKLASQVGFQRLLAFLGLLVLWQIGAMVFAIPIFPQALDVLPLFVQKAPVLLEHTAFTLGRILIALLISAFLAVPLGISLALFKSLNRFFDPLISLIYPIPKIVFLPIFYMLLGITEWSKILLLSLVLFFQIMVVVRDSALTISEELILSVRSLGAGRLALLRFIYLPASVPALLTSLRVSIGTAVAVLFIAEQSLTQKGLGYYIVVYSYQSLNYKEMYAGIMCVSLIGFVLYSVISYFEKKLLSYQSTRTS